MSSLLDLGQTQHFWFKTIPLWELLIHGVPRACAIPYKAELAIASEAALHRPYSHNVLHISLPTPNPPLSLEEGRHQMLSMQLSVS